MSSPLTLSVNADDGSAICTSFQLVNGRFRHSIALRRSDGLIIESWDDEIISQDEDWPASPPIQQLSLESIQGSPALLGVGQAGKSHWSISIETMRIDSQPALKFDLACRCRQLPSWLGSTYRRSLGMDDPLLSLQMIDLSPVEGEDNNPSGKTNSGRSNSGNAMLTVNCKIDSLAITKFPATFRWSYLVKLFEMA